MPADINQTLDRMHGHRASAIIRAGSPETAREAMKAAVDGGFRTVEFTLTTPGALDLIREFAANEALLVGAGTVLTPEEVQEAVQAGARFIVSPVCDPAVIVEATRCSAVSVPGTYTATEMQAAHTAGAHVVKLFPAPADVAEYVRSILGPLPHLRIFPTAGVDAENCLDVLAAGAWGVGFVRSLFDPADLAAQRYDAIRERARHIIGRLAEA